MMTTVLFTTRRALMIGAAQASVAITLSWPSQSAENLPKMVVTHDPSCGCCGVWIAHVKAAGFPIEVVRTAKLSPLKASLGVPESLTSCHTAQVGGYVIEGHVPADAIKRLLVERPKATGLAVADMPIGSPGMEMPGTPPEIYDVVLFAPDSQRAFARYRGSQKI
jgi:hypothetical protein